VPIPKEFQFSDETLKGLSPAQASERLARYTNWSDSARQKAASMAITKNRRISTTKMGGGYTWAEVPDTDANPEILDLVKDVGCAGGWCTEQRSYAIDYGSGQNRLHLLIDNKASPKVQLTVKQFEPNIEDFLAQLDDTEYDQLLQRVDPNFFVVANFDDPRVIKALEQSPEYQAWITRNPPVTSISEIKGVANETNLRNSPVLRATQDYVKKLDVEKKLDSVNNLDGINMTNIYSIPETALWDRLDKVPQGTSFGFKNLRGQFWSKLLEKNQGSKFIDKDEVPRLLNETLDELVGPVKKATGGMVERRTDAAQNYL
jgi:hypothetical protein